ncbi:MAG: hypothetical protein RR578_01535 [Bacilli bacterium]|uniref:hypothetical protein n=1 Tax=Algoriella sp. TaxID=1872434 RepID=UPI002FC61957
MGNLPTNNHRVTRCSGSVNPAHAACKPSKGERLKWEKSTSSNTLFVILNEDGRMLNNNEFPQNNRNLLVP